MTGVNGLIPKVYYLDLEVDSVPNSDGAPKASITQISVLDPSREKGKEVFEAYVQPHKLLQQRSSSSSFDPGASAPVRHKFKKVWPELKNWVNQGLDGNRLAVIVMHNGYENDWPILQNECARIQDAIPKYWKPFCSLYLARALHIEGDRSLSSLCHKFNVDLLPAHNSTNDVRMLKGVFEKMIGDTPIEEVLKKIPGEAHPVKQVAQAVRTAQAASLVFFDFESTGLFPKKGEAGENPRVVEVAGYIPECNQSFTSLVNPGCPIPKEASKVHGIYDNDVKEAPDFKTVWPQFVEWMNKHIQPTDQKIICLAGHNIWGYDLKVLDAECERVGLQKRRWKSFDTLALSRSLFKGIQGVSHRLQSLRQMMNIEENQAHRALGDVQVNYEVFKRFVEGVDSKTLNKSILSDHPILSLAAAISEEGKFNAKALTEKEVVKPEVKVVRKKVILEDEDDDRPVATSKKRGAAELEAKVPSSKLQVTFYDEEEDIVIV